MLNWTVIVALGLALPAFGQEENAGSAPPEQRPAIETLEGEALGARDPERAEVADTPGADDYSIRLDAALHQKTDQWGDAVTTAGDASYDAIAPLLRPLFYSTGHTYQERGVHNLLLTEDGGAPPYVIPLADGSRIAANVYQSPDFLEWTVGEGREVFGSALERLEGPSLESGYLPVLHTAYTDTRTNRFEQVVWSEAGLAYLEMTVTTAPAEDYSVLGIHFGDDARARFHFEAPEAFSAAEDSPETLAWRIGPGTHTLRAVWSPEAPLPEGVAVWPASRRRGAAWQARVAPYVRFNVPEARVMNAQRNLLIQNLMMRWRYSLGSVVYHGNFYQPESSETVQTLGEYGHTEANREGLDALVDMTKGAGQYTNWEMGEKLSHAAQYYYLTRDVDFVARHTEKWAAMCEAFRAQIEADPFGLLAKQRLSGDISKEDYYVHHLAVCWRGLRDMAEVWRQVGREDLHAKYRPAADRLKSAMDLGMGESIVAMDDGTLFVPRALRSDRTVYDPITDTRDGSYWNLVMPYAFASGYWPMDGPELGRIAGYMHLHGGLFLGLMRFNYYPTPIGASRADGLPGYYTTGVDNVYMPGYLRMIAAQDQADRLILSFYGKLAHGMTRNTFIAGEGDTLGARPGEYYRSSYGGPCSGNNTSFLLALRLMMVRESFDHDTGEPRGLYLAHATPRAWLEHGKELRVTEAPSAFGPVSYRIDSRLAEKRIVVDLTLPERNPSAEVKLKLRLPDPQQIAAVAAGGGETLPFDAASGIIDLTGHRGVLSLEVTTTAPPILRNGLTGGK